MKTVELSASQYRGPITSDGRDYEIHVHAGERARTYLLMGDAPGSILLWGPGPGDVQRMGAGEGFAWRMGGPGSAARGGPGKGSAVNSSGQGKAIRVGSGVGRAIHMVWGPNYSRPIVANGCDYAIWVPAGTAPESYELMGGWSGSIMVFGPGEGNAHRLSRGAGDAIRLDGAGNAVRAGPGPGNALHRAVGGKALRLGSGKGRAGELIESDDCDSLVAWATVFKAYSEVKAVLGCGFGKPC